MTDAELIDLQNRYIKLLEANLNTTVQSLVELEAERGSLIKQREALVAKIIELGGYKETL